MKTYIHDMLVQYDKAHPIRLHMPGHKGKLADKIFSHDITELSFSDNLRNPNGVIAQSERAYAGEFGIKFCHYLVNGSTAGLFAMAYCSRGKVLIESHCHIALKNALMLANKNIIVADTKYVEGIPQPLTLADIASYVERNGGIDTIILTSPNYYGQCADLRTIYKYCKSRKILLFVDSAHGAHFGLSKYLPQNACLFCDATVQSTHKTLGALTQTAVLLTDDSKLAFALKEYVNLFTTTSPSYLLLESIELAMYHACENRKNYQTLFQEVERFKANCRELGWDFAPTEDFTRIVLDCSARKMNAKAVYSALEKDGIYCEYADDRYIIAILSLFDNGLSLDAFFTALRALNVGTEKSAPSYVDSCFEQADVQRK